MSVLTSQCSNELLSAGIGWWIGVQPETVDAKSCSKVSGWLTGEVAVTTKSDMFRNFAAAYTSATNLAFDYSTTFQAFTIISAWNAALAAVVNYLQYRGEILTPCGAVQAHALGALFKRSMFPNSPGFSAALFAAIKAVDTPGAGVNISFNNATGNALLPYIVYSLNQDAVGATTPGSKRAVGTWSQRAGLKLTQQIVWPGGTVTPPHDPGCTMPWSQLC